MIYIWTPSHKISPKPHLKGFDYVSLYPLTYIRFANRGIQTHAYENRFEISSLQLQNTMNHLQVRATVNNTDQVHLIFSPEGELKTFRTGFPPHEKIHDQLSPSCLALICLLNRERFIPPYQEESTIFTLTFKDIQASYRQLKSLNASLDNFTRFYQNEMHQLVPQDKQIYHLQPHMSFDRENLVMHFSLIEGENRYKIQNIEMKLLIPLNRGTIMHLKDAPPLYLNLHHFDSFSQSLIQWIKLQIGVEQQHQPSHQIRVTSDYLEYLIPLFHNEDRWNLPLIFSNTTYTLYSKRTPEGLYHIQPKDPTDQVPLISTQHWIYPIQNTIYYGNSKIHDAIISKLIFPIRKELFLSPSQLNFLSMLSQNQEITLNIQGDLPTPIDSELFLYLDGIPSKGYTLSIRGLEGNPGFDFYPHWLDGLKLDYEVTPHPHADFTWILQAKHLILSNLFHLEKYLRKFGNLTLSPKLNIWHHPEPLHFQITTGNQKSLTLSIHHQDIPLNEEETSDFIRSLLDWDDMDDFVHHLPQDLKTLRNLLSELNISLNEGSPITLPLFRLYQIQSFEFQKLQFQTPLESKEFFHLERTTESNRLDHLHSHQKEGIDWLMKLRERGLSGILADDMGLGKTLQIITYLDLNFSKMAHPCLILVPASLLQTWQKELHRFAPHLPVHVIEGNAPTRLELLSHSTKQDVHFLLTTYDYFKRDLAFYQTLSFDSLILDEAQIIKNPQSQIKKALKNIQSRHRFALTGTPIENQLQDLWSLFDYILPGYLYDLPTFNRKFIHPILNGNQYQKERLKVLIQPFMLRRLKTQVLSSLPDKEHLTYYLPLHPLDQTLYDDTLKSIEKSLAMKEIGKNTFSVTYLNYLTRLRQIALDGRMINSTQNSISPKFETCLEIIHEAQDKDESVLVFSSFKEGLLLLSQYLSQTNLSHELFTGSTTRLKRDKIIQTFQSGQIPVLLISLKAGGLGLNLTKASRVIHLDPWWNVAAQDQATDRAYRIGQKNHLKVYQLISLGTIEESILNLQENKKALLDFIEPQFGKKIDLDWQLIQTLLNHL